MTAKDGTAKIFVQVYGLEDSDQVITADTLIVYSKLLLLVGLICCLLLITEKQEIMVKFSGKSNVEYAGTNNEYWNGDRGRSVGIFRENIRKENRAALQK
mgnify:CR=1 FL=1